jgi:hypothetical protein
LEVGSVSKITVSADGAGNSATEISLSGESLLNALHSEVGMSSVGDLPEGNLRGSSKENVLCAIGNQLHQSTSHFFGLYTYLRKKNVNLR